MGFLGNILDGNKREVARLNKIVQVIESYDEAMGKLNDEQLQQKTVEFKERINKGETLDEILPEAFAVVREAAWRVHKMKHFSVQLMGGIVLHEGNISEMKTGEGKTLVSTLPAYLNALTGDPVYIITVNDYLAERDRNEMGQIHEFLGLKVGFINRSLSKEQKQEAYKCDIIYGTNSEFGFDYLRDNLVTLKEDVVQTKHYFAIIDEVDSVLIDEARTPLIISGTGRHPSGYYQTVDMFVRSLNKEEYEKDDERQSINLSDDGMTKAEKVFGLKNIADYDNIELLHHIRQSLAAHFRMKRDQDYVVKDGEIMIVDKFTGRLMPGRRYSNGLHQALEAKEKVEIQKESKTLATITYQNYFKLYKKLAGMTGTAYTDKEEFKNLYSLKVVQIPTNKPMIRQDLDDVVYRTEEAKLRAIAQKIEECYKKGQPVLVGTVYIDKSERLSELLTKKKIAHRVLNAKQDAQEADIITQAGQKRAVTIATNMAGRGTDIKLGEGVAELGGLFVLGTERHESRRIDNQLRGRAGRQGDPGISQFFISLEDNLFERVGGDKLKKFMEMISPEEEAPLQDSILSKAIESAQKNVEAINYQIRRNTVQFDQMLNKQRAVIYKDRQTILNGDDMSQFIKKTIEEVAQNIVQEYTAETEYAENWDLEELCRTLNEQFLFRGAIDYSDVEDIEAVTREKILEDILKLAYNIYNLKETMMGEKRMRFLERVTMMKAIDKYWLQHLDMVEQMYQSIGLQSIGQKNPIQIFNEEAHEMFQQMLYEIKEETIRILFGLEIMTEEEKQKREQEREQQIKKDKKALEDQYVIDSRVLPRIPDDLPMIELKGNINAAEDIDVDIELYYMEEGWENHLKAFDQTVNGKGVFQLQFAKQEEKWDKGWYQVKISLLGELIKHLDFMVEDGQKLRARVQEQQQARQQRKAIFTNQSPEILLKGDVPEQVKTLEGELFLPNTKSITRFSLPMERQKFTINIKKPEQGWPLGDYRFVLKSEGQMVGEMLFTVIQEVKVNGRQLKIMLNGNLKQGKKVRGRLTTVPNNERIADFVFPIEQDGSVQVNMELPEGAEWKKGIYELTLLDDIKVLVNHLFAIV